MKLRKAVIADMAFIYYVRNNPSVAENCLNKEHISWMTHLKWYDKNMKNIYVGCEGHSKVGVVRIDSAIHIMVNPRFSGQGYGRKLLRKATRKAKKPIKATILNNNRESINLFESEGYKLKALVYEHS